MSKTLFRDQGYRFFFQDDEERPHVIVFNWDGEARYWLEPAIELDHTDKFTRLELEDVENLVDKHLDRLKAAWAERLSEPE